MWMREKCRPPSRASGLSGPTPSASIASRAASCRPDTIGATTVSEYATPT